MYYYTEVPAMKPDADKIMELRGFNRLYTGLLGILQSKVYGSEYSLSEARILYEISKGEHGTANELCRAARIDPGYMSRIIKRFETAGLIERTHGTDARNLEISLTEQGWNVFTELEKRSNEQIASLLKKLGADEQEDLVRSVAKVKKYLIKAAAGIVIRGYIKGDERYIIDRQLSLYASERGFTSNIWKSYLRDGMRDMIEKFDKDKDAVFILENNGVKSGCAAVKHDVDGVAQFRYFFVEPELRGTGAGRMLFEKALGFCREKSYRRVFLWTVSAQEAARKLYAKAGFRLMETHEDDSWGVKVLEERWDLDL